jgi:hypothetical protein
MHTYTHTHTQSHVYIHKSLIHTYIRPSTSDRFVRVLRNVLLINECGEKVYVQLKHARSAFLPSETSEMWKRLYFTLYLAKPRQNAGTVLQTNELFVYGDVHYVTDSVCKSVLKAFALFYKIFLLSVIRIVIAHCASEHTVQLYCMYRPAYSFIFLCAELLA